MMRTGTCVLQQKMISSESFDVPSDKTQLDSDDLILNQDNFYTIMPSVVWVLEQADFECAYIYRYLL